MTSELYVFAPPLAVGGGPLAPDAVLCGRIRWADGTGTFRYAQDWLDNPLGYDLDPINLRRITGDQSTRINEGVPGVLTDAGPDTWGRMLLEMDRGNLPTPLEALRLSNADGAGALRFSQSRSRPAPTRHAAPVATLEDLEATANAIAAGHPVERADLDRILGYGSTLGGARPKVNTLVDGAEWIAKFGRPGDQMDIPRLEAACLDLAGRCGLEVPEHRVIALNGRSALLVKRFDRDAGRRLHYLSLHALLSIERIQPAAVRAPTGAMTYGGIAALCRQIGVVDAGDVLFRRMLFNVCIANTDDHLRNHGLLFDGTWRHAPSFDLVSTGGTTQAIGIGTAGRERSLANAMSDIGRFGLTAARAARILAEVRDGLQEASHAFGACGMQAGDIGIVMRRFVP